VDLSQSSLQLPPQLLQASDVSIPDIPEPQDVMLQLLVRQLSQADLAGLDVCRQQGSRQGQQQV
jgi:hypothetical protein